ncbi:16S rRNA (cytosine(967)-C(5))-methyltransferase RsmB [Ottowia sp.]|uniref:16S rRNA (cytosine(967)-C(5))-methyltransferase RsmB n=1 Tax=Ottowia sp. TaxID=1898956 RepID=UPI003A83B4AC
MVASSTQRHNTPALHVQLQQASRMVHGVRQGRSLTSQLSAVESGLRPGVQALTFHALRWLGLAEGVRDQLVRRAPPAELDALLCTALTLMVTDENEQAYSAFTLVNQTVEAAKRHTATKPGAAMINACLRRFLRERDALIHNALAHDPVARWNHPAWWIKRLQADHPGAWQTVLEAAQHPAPMVLRVNAQRMGVQAYRDQLARDDVAATVIGPYAIQLDSPRPVQDLPGFAQGDVSVQSAAAQRAAPLLLHGMADKPLRILDACAAPGGKTAHLLEISPHAHVTALEIDPARSGRIEENLSRLGLQADVRVADAADPSSWWDGQPFDAIMLDAPCSASGIVGRHPDVRWLRRPTDIQALAGQQNRLLQALWPLLAPGGRLLYCTCSVFRQEGENQIKTFVAHHSDAVLQPSPGHLLPSIVTKPSGLGDNEQRDDDGFYYALLAQCAV